MKYSDIKASIETTLQGYLEEGMSQEEAEARILKASIAMFGEQKLGFIDLKYVYQILGYDFHGDLASQMDDIKKAIRLDYGLADIIRGAMKSGKSNQEARLDAVRIAYEAFQADKIEEPELLDMVLWSLGYRLKEEFLLLDDQAQKQELLYEEDN